MKKRLPYAVLAAAVAIPALVAPTPGFANEITPAESGLYFTSETGERGLFFSLEDWADLSGVEKGNLLAEYAEENIQILLAAEGFSKITTLKTINETGKAFGEAAVDFEENDITGDFKNGKTGEDFSVGDKEVVAPGLTVESISEINKQGVTVSIEKLTEDLEDQTIEVKDNNGNVVEVKSLNLVINETEATFVFKTALSADPTGVWTVAGKSFDTDVAAKLAAINTANTELKLYNALTAAGIENLVVANSSAYEGADKPAEGFKTLAEVQAFVDKVNAEQTTGAEKEEQVKELVKLLAPAQPSQVQVLAALASFERVNADFIGKYIIDLKTDNVISNSTPFKTVQAQLDTVNVSEVSDLITAAETSAKRADYNKAVVAVDFVREDDAENTNDKVKANLQKDLDLLNLVLNVKEASTAAQFANAYNALVAHVDNKATIGTEVFYTDLRTKYMDATKVLTSAESVTTAAHIEAAIVKVNTQKRAELYNDVANVVDANDGTETKTADVLKKLQNLAAYSDKEDFDIKTVETTEDRLKAYRTGLVALPAVDETDFTGAASPSAVQILIQGVQTKVTDANGTAVSTPLGQIANLSASSADSAVLEVLKNPELALGNVVDANVTTYVADLTAIQTAAAATGDTATVVKGLRIVITDLNQVANINNATKAEDVHTALLALSDNTEYINVPGVDRLFVATALLDARNKVTGPPAKVFTNLAIVRGALTTATDLHTDALKEVNKLTNDSDITTVITALKLVGNETFNELTTAQQSDIAEAFLDAAKYDDQDLVVPFRTLAAVKALMN